MQAMAKKCPEHIVTEVCLSVSGREPLLGLSLETEIIPRKLKKANKLSE